MKESPAKNENGFMRASFVFYVKRVVGLLFPVPVCYNTIKEHGGKLTERDTFGERLHTALKARGETGAWLARQIGTTTANISRYTSGESYPLALKYLVQISAALRVSTDYLLGVTDIMNPLPKGEETVKNFEGRYSYLFRDEDFLTCVEVYNALSDEDRKCMTGIVKQYGMNRNVLNADAKPSASAKTVDDK